MASLYRDSGKLSPVNKEIRQWQRRTATKTSLENITSFHLCFFAVISTHPTCTKTANYPGTKLGVAFKLRKRRKNSPSYAHVFHKTLNLVISRC